MSQQSTPAVTIVEDPTRVPDVDAAIEALIAVAIRHAPVPSPGTFAVCAYCGTTWDSQAQSCAGLADLMRVGTALGVSLHRR